MKTKFISKVLFVFLELLFNCSIATAANREWPMVQPVRQSVVVVDTSVKAAAFYIFGTDGVPKYLIECHDHEYQADPAFDYSGDFECRLTSLYSKESYSTLFTDDPHQSRDWQSRARFLVGDLFGSCEKDLAYGPVRRFRLRGMQISLSMKNIKTKPSRDKAESAEKKARRFASFTFDVEVVPNRLITSEIAEPAKPLCMPL